MKKRAALLCAAGLAIVKHIALLHDAHIDLQSQVGTGTTIRVTFPKNS